MLSLIQKMRHWLWKHDLYNKCPYCCSELMEHGFDPNTVYTCTNEKCSFGKEEEETEKESSN